MLEEKLIGKQVDAFEKFKICLKLPSNTEEAKKCKKKYFLFYRNIINERKKF